MKAIEALVILVAGAAVTCGYGRQTSEGAVKESPHSQTGTTSELSTSESSRLISEFGVGRFRLDMTLDAARRALPVARFARTSDGDGAALVEVTLAANESLILWADEDDPDTPIDWSKQIKTIETFSAAFHTAEGIRAGALVKDVEKVFGHTREIVKSEIESREYIEFEQQPVYLTLRLDYTGIFSAGKRTTTQFEPGGKILSIAVSSLSRR